MATNPYGAPAEQLAARFYGWERRGRGWDLYPGPVALEPPFRPFEGHYFIHPPPIDDGRRQTFLSRLFSRKPSGGTDEELPEEIKEPHARAAILPPALTELRVTLPEKFTLPIDAAEQFLLALRFCTEPISFELIGTSEVVLLQFASRDEDASYLLNQLQAFAPSAAVAPSQGFLSRVWFESEGEALIVDLGLSKEFMRPIRGLRTLSLDPLIALIGALGDLERGEAAVVQILFEPASEDWGESIERAVVDDDGDPFFLTGPACVKQAGLKVSKALFAVRPRLAVRAQTHARRMQILRMLMGGLSQLQLQGGNHFIALDSQGWSEDDQADDLLFRSAHRIGALLNAEELASLVHLPYGTIAGPRFDRHTKRTKEAPLAVRDKGARLGQNEHRGKSFPVCLSPDQRVRHTYVIGGSGTGKSSLLQSLILQDLEAGRGLAVLDPHGDLIDGVLSRMPGSRIGDVVVLNPADEEFPVGINILSAHSDLEKTLLASDLVAVFRRLSTSWGDQMNAVLANAILALLESRQGGTLLDLRRFLVDPHFRKSFLAQVEDSEVVYFWEKEFPLLIGRPASPLLTRLDAFLRPKLIRNIVAQERSLDFRKLMDDAGVLLAKLPHGAIGQENAELLGSLLVSKFHQIALSRQDLDAGTRPDFFLYVDEFHHFATPSMVSLLSGVRKYRLGLTLAHQNLVQLGSANDELLGSVLANASSRICFRLGDQDAKRLADGFSFFEARDLQNLGVGEAVMRFERAEDDFNLRTDPPPVIDQAAAIRQRDAVIESSRVRFATKKSELPVPEANTPSPQRGPDEELPQAPKQAPSTEKSPAPATALPTKASASGRGGQQHRYLQTLIKRLGEEQGFRVSLEAPVLSGTGNIDVVLEREEITVAVEISVTSSTGHEVGNLQKCLASGYHRVILTSPAQRNLERVRKRALEVFSPDELSRLSFVPPEEISELLSHFSLPPVRVETVKGYRVKTKFASPSDEEVKRSRLEAIRDVIGGSLKRSRS